MRPLLLKTVHGRSKGSSNEVQGMQHAQATGGQREHEAGQGGRAGRPGRVLLKVLTLWKLSSTADLHLITPIVTLGVSGVNALY